MDPQKKKTKGMANARVESRCHKAAVHNILIGKRNDFQKRQHELALEVI